MSSYYQSGRTAGEFLKKKKKKKKKKKNSCFKTSSHLFTAEEICSIK
jgi:hypothetical protein